MENELEPVKVIDQDSAKLFNIKSDVFYLDDENVLAGKIRFDGCEIVVKNPVFIINDEDQVIGSATLDVVDKIVTADLFIDYSSPERFDIETGARKWYPFLDGYYSVSTESHYMRATKYFVRALRLYRHETVDVRVKPLCL